LDWLRFRGFLRTIWESSFLSRFALMTTSSSKKKEKTERTAPTTTMGRTYLLTDTPEVKTARSSFLA